MILAAPFVGRDGLGSFLNDTRRVGEGAEIGVDQADFAIAILREWKGSMLYCIDPWISGYNDGDPISRRSQLDRESDYDKARSRLFTYGDRTRTIRTTSGKAAKEFRDGQLDFVYIDGNHDAKYFSGDLYTWWPKIRNGGIIAGHDFTTQPWGLGIQSVLLNFASLYSKDVCLIPEANPMEAWSFYVEK